MRALFLGAALLACAAPARADVLSIGDDGRVSIQAGPAVYLTPDGLGQPISRTQVEPHATVRTAPAEVQTHLRAASQAQAISPTLLEAVAWQESRFDPRAVSPKGAKGVMQLMPATARELGVDADDTAANIVGGAMYLRRMLLRYDGDVVKALAAYNAGPGAVDRHRGIPPFPETQAYVAAVLGRMARTALLDNPTLTRASK